MVNTLFNFILYLNTLNEYILYNIKSSLYFLFVSSIITQLRPNTYVGTLLSFMNNIHKLPLTLYHLLVYLV